MQTLVLNIGMIPVSIIPVRKAISHIQTGKAIALKNYETEFYGTNFMMFLPSVIKCTKSKYIPKHFTNVLPFNRKNVYIRDGGCCMYCGRKVSLSSFTFDHVVPRQDGGKTWWDNIVVSCLRCNGQKSNMILKGQKVKDRKYYKRELIRQPYVPRLSKSAPIQVVRKLEAEIPHETWIDYIYWNVLLKK